MPSVRRAGVHVALTGRPPRAVPGGTVAGGVIVQRLNNQAARAGCRKIEAKSTGSPGNIVPRGQKARISGDFQRFSADFPIGYLLAPPRILRGRASEKKITPQNPFIKWALLAFHLAGGYHPISRPGY